MELKTLKPSHVKRGTRVFMRVDCNVPILRGRVDERSTLRLERTLKDIRSYMKKGAIVIIAGHLGRPDGTYEKRWSLRPIAKWYERALKCEVKFIVHPIDKQARATIASLQPGSVCLLENMRFFPGETKNSMRFAKKLAKLADVYVNNAFGVCHRKHASVHRLARILTAYAGSVLVEETKELARARPHPFVFVLGGVKMKTKMPILQTLGRDAEAILLGGGIGIVATSILEKTILRIDRVPIAREELALMRRALKQFGDKLLIPVDYVCEKAGTRGVIPATDVKPEDHLIDIGPKTIALYKKQIKRAKSSVFNGSMGMIEEGGKKGTRAIALAPMAVKKPYRLVGGGDTVGYLQRNNLLGLFHFISTGGGAMLAFLAKQDLPGLIVLKK